MNKKSIDKNKENELIFYAYRNAIRLETAFHKIILHLQESNHLLSDKRNIHIQFNQFKKSIYQSKENIFANYFNIIELLIKLELTQIGKNDLLSKNISLPNSKEIIENQSKNLSTILKDITIQIIEFIKKIQNSKSLENNMFAIDHNEFLYPWWLNNLSNNH